MFAAQFYLLILITSHSASLYALFVKGVCILRAAANDNTGST